MHVAYYLFFFIVSCILTIILTARWRKRFDVNLPLIFLCVDITNLGYVLYYLSGDLEEAVLTNKIIYLGGCFLPLLVLFLVIRLCRFRMSSRIKAVLLTISMVVFAGAMTTGLYPVFYKSVEYRLVDGIVYLDKKYTIFHTFFNVILISYFVAGLVLMIYTSVKRKDVSHKVLALLVLPGLMCITGFWISRTSSTFAAMPVLYGASLIIYLVIMHKISMYDIIDTGIEALAEEGDTGFISLDNRLNYMGCNETAMKILPDLARLQVDTRIRDYRGFEDTLLYWLAEFTDEDKDGVIKDQFTYETDGRYYYVNVSYLMDKGRPRGYQFFFMDNTKEQRYIREINEYNENLEEKVKEKTAHIVDMHNRLVLGMATMVESRDNSTGGHVRRTSDLVRMLIDKILEDNDLNLDDEFCEDVIKAAPMHDLGKIAVDDRILRKPGRFEPEEFEEMKKHAAEGARIVHEILKGTEDKLFRRVAENVAHFHHERWDGSGYPLGLKGEDIPLEARIMAIADVYDALVSKRVYKEKMSFEKADSIIMEGMGRHFDKKLEQYYVAARPEFEAYYTQLVDE
jgi:putative two-component system response regulator